MDNSLGRWDASFGDGSGMFFLDNSVTILLPDMQDERGAYGSGWVIILLSLLFLFPHSLFSSIFLETHKQLSWPPL